VFLYAYDIIVYKSFNFETQVHVYTNIRHCMDLVCRFNVLVTYLQQQKTTTSYLMEDKHLHFLTTSV